MHTDDVQRLACPGCHGRVAYAGTAPDGILRDGRLTCPCCRERWPVRRGLPRLFREHEVRGSDRLMRLIYDGLPFLHDAACRYAIPVSQLGRRGLDGTERSLRLAYLPRLALDRLRPRAEPYRILETGIGTGANVPLVLGGLPSGVPVELWGLDLSVGMLGQCRRRREPLRLAEERLVVADAHRLPFPDASFDRVFHVGATNSFDSPAIALAEMARVARPGTPIVVVDEQLEPDRRHSLYHRAWFKAVTFYSDDARSPRHHLPEAAEVVHDEQIDRFFYCLVFRMPQP